MMTRRCAKNTSTCTTGTPYNEAPDGSATARLGAATIQHALASEYLLPKLFIVV